MAGLRRPSPSPRPRQDPATADVTEEAPEVIDEATTTVEPVAEVEAPPEAPAEPAEDAAEGPAASAAPAAPSPRPKSRDTGTPKPADYAAAELAAAAEAEPGPEEDKPRRRRNPFVIAGALFGVALVLAGLAVWFKIEDNNLSAATSNTALLDVARTSQVNQAATSAVETLFSYDYNNVAKTQNAANDLLLGGDVKNKYNSLMGEVERLAPQQKIVVTVKASRSAVVLLDGDRAKVMVFVDQTQTRTDLNQTSSGSAQLWVAMQYVGGTWKVNDLQIYSSPPAATPSTTPAPPPAPASR